MNKFNNLNIVEVTALQKLVEKQLKALKDGGEVVATGNHAFNFDVHLDGSISRAADTQAFPSFFLANFLKPMLLKYAETLGKEEGRQWLQNLMNSQGALGAVIQLGSEAVLMSVDAGLTGIWAIAEAKAKEKFQEVTQKVDRSGNTVVVGALEKIAASSTDSDFNPEALRLPDTLSFAALDPKKIKSAKQK